MENLVKLLNTAYEREYIDVFLYLKEADIFRKKLVKGEEIAQIFLTFSNQELRHADRLAMKLIELGEKPEWTFELITPSNSLRETLRRHLEYETKSYHFYGELIGITEDPDFQIILKGIREDEKEHLEKVVYLLKNLR